MERIVDFAKKDWYFECYKEYLRITGHREANISCLQRHIPRALKQLELPQDRSTFNIFSLGAGEGKVDHEILKTVQKRYMDADEQLQKVKILNTAVEPHPSMVDQYKEFISRIPKDEEAVEFDLRQVTFEEYVQTKHEPNQYDLIQAIHSLYFVDSLESALNHCYYNELGDKGLIACILIDDEFIMHAIAPIVQKSQDGEGSAFRTSTDIAAVAEKNAWEFEKVYCPILIDVTGILRHNSDEGNMLLDFLSFVPDFRQSADPEIVASVLELLETRSTQDKDGRLVVKAASELILIYKS